MDYPLVSVIIPVYKVERYLAECVESVIGQDYPTLEIILVDDGSPDSCPKMCDRYAEEHGNVRVIHQPNRGLGPARNTGMEAASGEYVTFVDSDDCLDGADAIRRMAERAEETCADIVIGLYRRLKGREPGGVRCRRLLDGSPAETADLRFGRLILSNHLISAWGKLYRRAFLADNGLMFRNYFSEDKAFNMLCCACRPVCAFVDGSVYLYRVNADSISSRYQDDYYLSSWIAMTYDFLRFLSALGLQEADNDLAACHLCIGSAFLASDGVTHIGIPATVKALSEYGKDPLVRKAVRQAACGKHIDQIMPAAWKAVIWGTALLCSLHAYALLASGVWAARKAVDLYRAARRRRRPGRLRIRSSKRAEEDRTG